MFKPLWVEINLYVFRSIPEFLKSPTLDVISRTETGGVVTSHM